MPDGQLFPVGDPAELPVHPVADLFAMMADGDIADLAADIKANGQRFPIMLDAAGEMLIDGRNRRAACRMIGVTPVFARLDKGVNPVAYIWSVNVARRHLSKGQIAIAAAQVRSVSDQGQREAAKRGGARDRGAILPQEALNVTSGALAKARAVLRYSAELAAAVMADEPAA